MGEATTSAGFSTIKSLIGLVNTARGQLEARKRELEDAVEDAVGAGPVLLTTQGPVLVRWESGYAVEKNSGLKVHCLIVGSMQCTALTKKGRRCNNGIDIDWARDEDEVFAWLTVDEERRLFRQLCDTHDDGRVGDFDPDWILL